jgi:hypothetical protein
MRVPQAATIDFSGAAIGGLITYTGVSLDVSTELDLDDATLLVLNVTAGDASSLNPFDTISLSAETPRRAAESFMGVRLG